jgi:hypothetical protein
LVRFARGVEGKPYKWGQTNWGDCSGAVSAIANYATGRSPFASRFATPTEGRELAARGFKSGLGPPGSLNIGWFNGGPAGGHTAATLPDGTNFEMGGARGNGQFGGRAAGAKDSMFTNHAHLPPEFFQGLDGGAPTLGSSVSSRSGGGGGSSSVGGSSSSSGGSSMSYRAATDQELTGASNKVDSANKSVTQAEQKVDDRGYAVEKAQRRLDELKASGKANDGQISDAERALEVANRELADANDDLAEKRRKAADAEADYTDLAENGKLEATKASSSSKSGGGSGDASDLGKTFASGIFESFGIDGGLFSNPMEWPSVKSLMAGVNFMGGMLANLTGKETEGTATGGGGFAGGAADAVGLGGLLSVIPKISDIAPGALNPAVDSSSTLVSDVSGLAPAAAESVDATRAPGGVDNSININGNVGMDPNAMRDKLRSEQNARTRTTVVR